MPSIKDSTELAADEIACEYLIGQEGITFRSAFGMLHELKAIFAEASSAQFFYPSN